MIVCIVAIHCTVYAAPWRFIAVGDSRGSSGGSNNTILSEIAHQAVLDDVDFIIFTGDLVLSITTSGQFEQHLLGWCDAWQEAYDAGIPVYAVRGNHELGDVWSGYPFGPYPEPDPNDNNALRWLEVFGPNAPASRRLPDNGPPRERYMTYAVEHKNALIIMLDQYAGLDHYFAHYINQQWLDAQLASNTRPHVFAGAHEHAFRVRHTDCLDYFPDKRDAFWKSLADAGGRTYFCAHDHFYDHALIHDTDTNPDNDMHQLTIATAGAPLYYWLPPYIGDNSTYTPEQLHHTETYGYILIEVDDFDVTLTWKKRTSNELLCEGIYEPNEVWGYHVTGRPFMLFPNGGENLVANSIQTLQWKTTDGADIDYVLLEYSLDNGDTWSDIDITANTGSYDWVVPTADSNQCLVRISDLFDPVLGSDVSDAIFTVFRCERILLGDVNGDCYVNLKDLALLAENYLSCGNPFDPQCSE